MAQSLLRYASKTEAGNPDSCVFHLLALKTKAERERAQLISITTYNGDRFPKDLFGVVLPWLPVKDVLRFKSVCKEWYSIISTPQFATNHLINNRYNNDNCLIVHDSVDYTNVCVEMVLLDDTPRALAWQTLCIRGQLHSTTLRGPCDGLYYLHDHDDFRALWNPAINEYRTLPPLIMKPDPPADTVYDGDEVYGFGCDPLTGDYKVVTIQSYWSETLQNETTYPLSVLVYSLRTGSWKYCGDLTQYYILRRNDCYIFVKGCCFWYGKEFTPDDRNYRELIVSFDMASDTFQEMHIPNYQEMPIPDYQQRYSNTLVMYDDSLAFFSMCYKDRVEKINIWTLNQRIWTKKITVRIRGIWRVFGQLKSNTVLLEGSFHKLVLYDLNTNEIKDLEYWGDERLHGPVAYMESLVSVKDKNNPGKAEDDGEVEADIGQV